MKVELQFCNKYMCDVGGFCNDRLKRSMSLAFPTKKRRMRAAGKKDIGN